MELDKRIKDGRRPLCCFDIKEAIQFIEMKGYFANDLGAFKYLGFTDYSQRSTTLSYGTLKEVDNDSEKAFSDEISHKFNYFLPEEWIEPEQKYRPYTLEEFRSKFPLLSSITFREKDTETVYTLCFLGYTEYKDNDYEPFVTLGACEFRLSELFEEYELLDSENKYVPFGTFKTE